MAPTNLTVPFLGLDTFIVDICPPKMKRRPAAGGPAACYSIVEVAGADPPETVWHLEPFGLARMRQDSDAGW